MIVGVIKSSWPRLPMNEPKKDGLILGFGMAYVQFLVVTITLPKTNSEFTSEIRRAPNPKRERSYSNHPFSGANG